MRRRTNLQEAASHTTETDCQTYRHIHTYIHTRCGGARPAILDESTSAISERERESERGYIGTAAAAGDDDSAVARCARVLFRAACTPVRTLRAARRSSVSSSVVLLLVSQARTIFLYYTLSY